MYIYGVLQAVADMEKTATMIPGTTIFPAGIAAVAAPEGEKWRAAGGATLGAELGSLGGLIGGGLLGAPFGLRGIIPLSILGTLGGGIYGGIKGYKAALD